MARVFISVNYDLEIDDEDMGWLFEENEQEADKKFLLREYRNKQNPYLEFTIQSDGKEKIYFGTY